ncbi:sulfotransferase family protein [Rhodovibrionaceae bacterium A322]
MDNQQYRQQAEAIQALREKQLFFVMGAPKSGTTWLQRLLDSHPEVLCSGEGHFADTFAAKLSKLYEEYNNQQGIVRRQVYDDKPYYSPANAQSFNFLMISFISMMLGQREIGPEIKCVGDKTPRSALYPEFFYRAFPNCKLVHIIRDGRDVVVSQLHHAYRAGYEKAIDPATPDHLDFVDRYINMWASNVEKARGFGDNHPDSYIEVRYEDLHARPEEEMARIFDRLGCDADAEVVKACVDTASFEKLSGGRKKGEEDKQSFLRRGMVGDGVKDLKDEAIGIINQRAKGLLTSLNYLSA